MLKRRDFLALALAGASAPKFWARPALAQAKYPDRPIRLVIPYAAGGAFDAVGRPWADKMKTLLGTVVVENQGGAAGSLAGAAVARAEPDGYTLLLGSTGGFALYALTTSRPIYDPIKELEPVSILAGMTYAIAIHPGLPVSSLSELVQYAKANPGKLSYGTTGAGSMNHLIGELFKFSADTPDIVHVPYKGAGPAISDLVSGHVPIVVPAVNRQVLELHRTGKVRVLAVTSPKRLVAAPELPTGPEAGMPKLTAQNFIGLVGPTGMPKGISQQIAEASRTAMADDALRQLLVGAGFEPYADSNPEQFRSFAEQIVTQWAPITKAIGLTTN
jgi:tripartite-type tricarboxylate transporter receptor subunit TctC